MSLSPLDMWCLADDLSVLNAAILISDGDPGDLLTRPVWTIPDQKLVIKAIRASSSIGGSWPSARPHNEFHVASLAKSEALLEALQKEADVRASMEALIRPAFQALKTALLNDRLPATFVFIPINEGDVSRLYKGIYSEALDGEESRIPNMREEPDWDKTTIRVDNLKSWLAKKNNFPKFFFPVHSADSFENPKHDRYSAELACAVAAWNAVKYASPGKSVKATIESWVIANAEQFGLDRGGEGLSDLALKRITTMVNWGKGGGAPRTPGGTDGASR